ncbi:DUF4239 domain-containing protein [Streptomyces sp. SID8379]|uniref:bestrophin-like domain n=1 Tax=unclassified Streptomyces TaxID=2593676 RepID=UPI00037457CA|nr:MULTISPECIES: DUF4239 domain-containing protein [unclassified Streptomyces]MYW70122.1 DUF4239 domain-containing protein [Streptomyces sp. SID8379]
MYLLWALVALAAFVCGAGLTLLWHRYVGPRAGTDGMPVMAAACGTVASLYVLTIAFLIVSASSSLGDARAEAEAEAGALRDAYLAADHFTSDERGRLQRQVRGYARTVIDVEWPTLARDPAAPAAWSRLDGLRDLALDSRGASAEVRADLHRAVGDLYTQRRLRVAAATESVPPLLLGFLITTAVVVPVFFLLMGWPSGPRAAVGLGVVAALFASGIFIVLQLDHPYAHGMRISPDSFREALVRMDQIDGRHFAGS